MKVIGYNAAGNADTLEIIEMDQPVVGPRDLLVAVEGISVNPVDVKLRAGVEPEWRCARAWVRCGWRRH